jgi:Ankyrin repeats (3 copies)/Ankyrin repeat
MNAQTLYSLIRKSGIDKTPSLLSSKEDILDLLNELFNRDDSEIVDFIKQGILHEDSHIVEMFLNIVNITEIHQHYLIKEFKILALQQAFFCSNRELINLLWKELASEYSTANLANMCMNYAVAGGHQNIILELLGLGADINYIDIDPKIECCANTPLMMAASHNNVNMLKFLIQHGADPKFEFSNGCNLCDAFGSAMLEHTPDAFQYLLNFYKEDTLFLNEFFKNAISLSDIQFHIVEWLLVGGCNINTRFKGGGTPLIQAVKSGFIEPVIFFVEAGADVNLLDDRGLTPLLWANYYELQEAIEFLTPLSALEIVKLVQKQLNILNSSDKSAREALEKLLFPFL